MKHEASLWTEWDRAFALFDERQVVALLRHGVPLPAFLNTCLGAETISAEGHLYQPDEDGQNAIIQPIFEWAHSGPHLDGNGHLLPEPYPEPELLLVDLIAWLPDHSDRWRFRRGEPALMLGQENLEDAARPGTPVLLRRTPLSWLQAGCQGICIIEPNGLRPAFVGVPGRVPHVICEDLAHGEQFEKWLRQRDPALPNISVIVSEAT